MGRIETWNNELASARSLLAAFQAGRIRVSEGPNPLDGTNWQTSTVAAQARWEARVAMLERLTERSPD